jgi:hypothetical protein
MHMYACSRHNQHLLQPCPAVLTPPPPLPPRSTNLSNPESETLLDEGLKLWSVALASAHSVPEPLVQLLPQVGAQLVQEGKQPWQACFSPPADLPAPA